MKQANVKKEKERLIISLSIKKLGGYGVAKEIAKRFKEKGIHYDDFRKSKCSAAYVWKDWYLKVFFPGYENGLIELNISKPNPDIKKTMDLIMDLISNIAVKSEKNKVFLSSYQTFESLNKTICAINTKSYEDYYFNDESKIGSMSLMKTYNLTIKRMNSCRVKCEDRVTVSMRLELGMITFIPNIISKFFSEASKTRLEILEGIEE